MNGTTTIWIVTGKSESGDDYGPFSYKHKPTDDQLRELCHMVDGDENEDGPGDYGSYVHLNVKETTVDLRGKHVKLNISGTADEDKDNT